MISEWRIGELHSLTTADGLEVVVGRNSNIQFRVFGNYGAPPTDFITRRGYRQHGVSEVDIFAGPRTVSVELYRDGVAGRQEYWDMRSELLEFLRFNRGGPIKFTVRLPDGETRSLDVRADPGLSFPPAERAEWDVLERVDFVAFDPFWYGDAVSVNADGSSVSTDQLAFPIEFPIFFGGANDAARSTGDLAYEGTWLTYPIITIYGPYNAVTIDNLMTNAQISMLVPIGDGERRVIDLTPGEQSIIKGVSQSAFNELAPESDLVNFYIQPLPLASGAVQEIVAYFDNGSSNSRMTVEYLPRFFGI